MDEKLVCLNRLTQARQDLAEISARVAALAARIPEPVASVAEALASLTPEQQEVLWFHRTEALAVIAQQIVEEQHQWQQLTAQYQHAMVEWQQLVERGDWTCMSDLGSRLNDRRNELSQRRTALRELEVLYEELWAAPDSTDPSMTAR
ncbi:hypothetical protein [Gemmatimonas aurantiaca]|uniref:hypothetical protein n=1 Tax=Gemmatimonas aurantiaca TaxID=173480 RepID=UPI00301DCD5B